MFFEFGGDFLKFLYFLWLFIVPTGFPLQRKWFSWKKSTRFAGFLAMIFTSQWKHLQKFMHSEKDLEISWKIRICFVCQSYYRTRRLGVVRGSDFLEKSIRFAGFLVVIFTSQTKNLQQILHSEKNLGNFWGFCNFLSFHLADWKSSQKVMVF